MQTYIVTYKPQEKTTRSKVLFGKHIFPGESRVLTEKQANSIKQDKDFVIAIKKDEKGKS